MTANSAFIARRSEQKRRNQFIRACAVDVMVAVNSDTFYTVTFLCALG